MKNSKVINAFNEGSKNYDKNRKKAVPLMNQYYKTAQELTKGYENPKILDLGAGTGILTELLHQQYPTSEITLMDLSHNMLEIAKDKFKNITTFKYLEEDYLTFNFPENYDIIVSSLSIHHLNDSDKKTLYKKIYDNLNKDGIFINADEVKGATQKTEDMFKNMENSYLQKQDIPEEEKQTLLERRKLDQPATLLDNIKWFEEIGYRNVDVFFKYYRYFVIYGQK